MKNITKAQFIQQGKKGINYHGSTFIKQTAKDKTITAIKQNIDTCKLSERTLTNSTLTSLRFATTDGYSYLNISGSSIYITTFESDKYNVLLVVDDIPDTDQTSIVAYSVNK